MTNNEYERAKQDITKIFGKIKEDIACNGPSTISTDLVCDTIEVLSELVDLSALIVPRMNEVDMAIDDMTTEYFDEGLFQ